MEEECDLKESVAGWEEAPCTACTLPSQVDKNIQFQMRGLCDRWAWVLVVQNLITDHGCIQVSIFRTGFDRSYMVTNEPTSGMISYIGRCPHVPTCVECDRPVLVQGRSTP